MAEFFAVASVILALVGGPPYLFDILRRKTKPERATWFIWSVQSLIAFGSSVVLGAHWSLLFIGLNAAGNLLVFLLALKYGVGGWRTVDKIAGIVAFGGLALSLVARSPFIALAGVILADFAGCVPTYVKVYHLPGSETTFTWLAFATASLLAVFSVGKFNWSLIAYPLYLAVANYAVVVFQLLGKWVEQHRKRATSASKGQ